MKNIHRIIRDYNTKFGLSHSVSTEDIIISSRTDNGGGLMLTAITATPCYNLFITYSDRCLIALDVKNLSKTKC